MENALKYKCPCCGGAIVFDSRLQKMKCPYCDTEFDLDTLEQFEKENLESDTDPVWEAENVERGREEMNSDGLVTYVCEACGGQIIADQNMAASSCPYCGNSVIVMKQLSGVLKPDMVIPFKLDKKQAQERLRIHLKGKVLLPSMFKEENRIQEMKGIYVPFWLYDCDARADIRCRGTRVRVWHSGDYEYMETSYYLICRSGEIGFAMVPVDGSSKMDDALMQSIEPFDYSEAVNFQTAYLAGFFADKYDQSASDCAWIANTRMRNSTMQCFMNTIHGYATCIPEHTNIQLKEGRITYALLPVWLLNTVYKGKKYTFAMNGQTGKFVGNLPVDKGKAFWIGTAVMAVTSTATWLMPAIFAAANLSPGAAQQYIYDNGDLLTAQEEADLQEYLGEISGEYECSVIAATTNTFDGKSRQEYTDDFYFDQDLGYDNREDGIILMVNLPEREFQYGTYGRTIDIFTDYVLEEMDRQVTPYLSSGDYAKAFESYADRTEEYLEESLSERSYSKNSGSTTQLGISLGAGLLVTILVLVILFRQLKSVGTKNRAQEYIREGSFRVTRANDLFLYRTMSRHRIERDHGSGSGGGIHTHTTSGGHRAGGRGGSF